MQGDVHQRRGLRRVGVRAADRFVDDLVDDAEPQQVRRGDLQRLRGFDFLPGVAPQDCGAPFGRNHAVDRKLVHQDAIANGNAKGAAAAAFAVHQHDHRHLQHRHLAQVERDRFGDAALLRFDPGYAAGVSTKQMIGRPNFCAISIVRSALR